MARRDRSEPAGPAPRVGLALAGGGPQGAVYEIGALRALEEAVDGLDLGGLHVYVGLSAGAFIAANLVNGLTMRQMCRAIVKHEPGEHPFVPETFFTLARSELGKRVLSVPRLLVEAVDDYVRNRRDVTLREALTRLSRALPVGVFDNEPIRAYLEKIYSLKGRTDDFRKLRRKLVVVAADLDSGQAVRFGEPPFDAVPISTAVQASGALPGVYPPVVIGGRHYVDGVLLKTLHGSVALESGAKLLICLNPFVPVDTTTAVERGVMRRGKLIDRGLVSVLSQSVRTLVHSRLEVGLASYYERFEGVDLMLIEPSRDDYRMFFTNIFSFAQRRAVCEHAYDTTRRQLLERYDEWAPMLARHGLSLDRAVLEQERDLWAGVELPPPPASGRRGRAATAVLDELSGVLDRLDALLAAPEPESEPAPESAAPVLPFGTRRQERGRKTA
ncbi:MAG: patatin-like phospholipase family protein [Acidobacteriota bacterium]|nr:patatin-like phospholipase family protein [Acidobacteriota bacterium]MDH3524529.1 patatin-like phospholipase family protein [Acidobacteriota bacterium]